MHEARKKPRKGSGICLESEDQINPVKSTKSLPSSFEIRNKSSKKNPRLRAKSPSEEIISKDVYGKKEIKYKFTQKPTGHIEEYR